MGRLRISCALLALAALPGCATVVGTLAGPVTGPLHAEQHTHGAPPWFVPLVYPLSIPFGVICGFTTGVAADVGFVLSGGEYGAPGHPPFAAVFDPTSPDWGRYRADAVLAERDPIGPRQ